MKNTSPKKKKINNLYKKSVLSMFTNIHRKWILKILQMFLSFHTNKCWFTVSFFKCHMSWHQQIFSTDFSTGLTTQTDSENLKDCHSWNCHYILCQPIWLLNVRVLTAFFNSFSLILFIYLKHRTRTFWIITNCKQNMVVNNKCHAVHILVPESITRSTVLEWCVLFPIQFLTRIT